MLHRKRKKTYTGMQSEIDNKKKNTVPFFQNINNYYLIVLRALALRLSLIWECTRSFVANALINESSPANTVEHIMRAS